MTKTHIRIGGVPEHFNLPIHQIKENGKFDQHGISMEWTDFYGGWRRGSRKAEAVLITMISLYMRPDSIYLSIFSEIVTA